MLTANLHLKARTIQLDYLKVFWRQEVAIASPLSPGPETGTVTLLPYLAGLGRQEPI